MSAENVYKLPDGALTVDQRLARIETAVDRLTRKLERVIWYVIAVTASGAVGGVGINVLHGLLG